jgi:exocyst complex protein 7
MRGSWSQKGLETYGKRVIDRAETIDSIAAGREFGKWVDNLMIVAEVSPVLIHSADISLNTINRTNGIC